LEVLVHFALEETEKFLFQRSV